MSKILHLHNVPVVAAKDKLVHQIADGLVTEEFGASGVVHVGHLDPQRVKLFALVQAANLRSATTFLLLKQAQPQNYPFYSSSSSVCGLNSVFPVICHKKKLLQNNNLKFECFLKLKSTIAFSFQNG